MRNVTNIVLEQAIAHTLKRNENGGIKLSQRTDPLTNDRLIKYYIGHIKASLKDAGTKAAKFESISPELTSGICKYLLHDQYIFNWDDIPGNDTGVLIKFLKENYNVHWIKPGGIHKLGGNEKIEVFSSNNSLSMSFNTEKTQVNLIIDNTIQDDKLIVKNENGVLKVYRDRLDFVEGSKKLAEKLHAILEEDKRPNECDLIVCIYRDEDDQKNSKYLALLTIEVSKGLNRKLKQDSNGIEYITYDFDRESLPTLSEKLQKCAFIQQLEPRPDYDMLVLDKIITGDVSKFFFSTFLRAELAFDNATLTQNLIKGLTAACNDVRPNLKPEKVEYIEQSIQNALKNERFNIDTFVTPLSIPEDEKKIVEEAISKNLADREIEIDKKITKKFTEKAIFKGDGGLKITVNRNDQDLIKVKHTPNDEKPYYLVEIKTKNWEEVLK